MTEYAVYVETKGREIYYVKANSAEEAEEIWSDYEPTVSEVRDAWVYDVEEAQ